MSATTPGSGAGARWIAAVDIGATTTSVALCGLPLDWRAGPRLGSWRFATPGDPARLVHGLATRVEGALARVSGQLVAVGVAAPGPVDAARGVIVHSPNLGWRDVPIAQRINAALAVPVALDDDANLGALGEVTWGSPRTPSDGLVAYLTLSSGVGLGIAGRPGIWRGAHGLAGEIGHLVIDQGGVRCACGARGCIETSLGGLALARAWRQASGANADQPASALFDAAGNGHPEAARIVDRATDTLARTLAIVAIVLDPSRIAIGGSLGLAQGDFVRAGAERARSLVLPELAAQLSVDRASLGRAAVLAGAAVIAPIGH